jgi:translation elongation factor P/translation initiation factor 5A
MATIRKDWKRDKLVLVGKRVRELRRGDVIVSGGKAMKVVSNKSLGTGEHAVGLEPMAKDMI